ncbi:hypothetical protein Droror1_Dr00019421 [Drosera rotundifolia]
MINEWEKITSSGGGGADRFTGGGVDDSDYCNGGGGEDDDNDDEDEDDAQASLRTLNDSSSFLFIPRPANSPATRASHQSTASATSPRPGCPAVAACWQPSFLPSSHEVTPVVFDVNSGGGNEVVKTCLAAMGFGFAAGTTDGLGAFDFKQGDAKERSDNDEIYDQLEKALTEAENATKGLIPTNEENKEDKNKTVTLKSLDGATFVVDVAVTTLTETVKHWLDEENDTDKAIPFPNVTSTILAIVIEYCKKHAGPEPEDCVVKDALKEWDAKFTNVDQTATNYMDIKGLLDLFCQSAADMIKDKIVEEVWKIFNIENDFTEKEERALWDEHKWAFE